MSYFGKEDCPYEDSYGHCMVSSYDAINKRPTDYVPNDARRKKSKLYAAEDQVLLYVVAEYFWNSDADEHNQWNDISSEERTRIVESIRESIVEIVKGDNNQ